MGLWAVDYWTKAMERLPTYVIVRAWTEAGALRQARRLSYSYRFEGLCEDNQLDVRRVYFDKGSLDPHGHTIRRDTFDQYGPRWTQMCANCGETFVLPNGDEHYCEECRG